jgi:glutamate racemase
MPYGEKSPEAIKYFCLKITRFLIEQDCKAIVIACNTASSYAYKDVQEFSGKSTPVISVIEPVVEYITQKADVHKIGVIGTNGTTKSKIYPQKIHALKPELEVASLATPLLAPMIEEGFFNNNISKTIINSYLSKPKLKKIDALILACTHYPLIKPEIKRYYEKEIYIVDSAEVVAQYTKKKLDEKGLLNPSTEKKSHRFYVSDYTEYFEKSTKLFFKDKIELIQENLWS